MKYATSLFWIATGGLAIQPAVVAGEYLSIDTAQRAAFAQAEQFQEITPVLTTEQREKIAALAGPQARHGKLRVWRAIGNGQIIGYFFVDEVIGREDFITYATSIDSEGKLGNVEVLAYRESHGAEIRNSAWRKQFVGHDNLNALRFAIDIKNIAGATLSCQHVTQGVRWLMALWQVALHVEYP
jgi:Na+-translocating ferredoxin:NAD+ oxidoreductase RnfG subunit